MKPKGATTYKTEELENTALEAIEAYKLTSVDDIVAFIPCGRSTFYEHKLDKSTLLKDAVNKNKIMMKQHIKKKWYDSDNATTDIALFKLLGTQDERDALNGVNRFNIDLGNRGTILDHLDKLTEDGKNIESES